MAKRRTNQNAKRNVRSNRVPLMQIREDGDARNAQVDRFIATYSNVAESTSALIKTAFNFGVPSTGTNAQTTFTWSGIKGTDDWISFAQQYTKWRINWILFDVYYTDPSLNLPIYASTFHGIFTGTPPTAWTNLDGVVDGADSQIATSVTPKLSFYWIANGVEERAFQDEAASQDFGGIRLISPVGTASPGTIIARVVVAAQCVFKGRE